MWSGVDKEHHGYPIKVQALKEMKAAYPSGRFWIKGDGCDIKPALQQSVRGVWNGDADLGDGALQALRTDYEFRMNTFKNLASPQENIEQVKVDLENVTVNLETDKQFLVQGIMKAQKNYTDKSKTRNPSKKVLMELSWERVEYSDLLQQCQSLLSYVKTLKVSVGQSSQVLHVQKSMCDKKTDWENYLRNLFVKRRQPAATHVFIFLLSDECRNKKPYCLPIQYVPYHSLKDQTVRELTNKIRKEMDNLGMLSIAIPAGILQPPFYKDGRLKALNYGSLGTVVGHEITHGFDNQGSEYDENGNVREWWTKKSRENFVKRSTCLIKQYNKVQIFGYKADGNKTLSENIADNGGLKYAFRAYQKWRYIHGNEDKLPALPFNNDQLFFIGFAQGLCAKYNKRYVKTLLDRNVHSLDPVRVRVPVSTFPEFSKAFGCTPPKNTCTVW